MILDYIDVFWNKVFIMGHFMLLSIVHIFL